MCIWCKTDTRLNEPHLCPSTKYLNFIFSDIYTLPYTVCQLLISDSLHSFIYKKTNSHNTNINNHITLSSYHPHIIPLIISVLIAQNNATYRWKLGSN